MYFYDVNRQVFLTDEIHQVPELSIEVSDDDFQYFIEERAKGKEIYIKDNQLFLTPVKPSKHHKWNGSEWILTEEDKARILKKEQKKAWLNIREHRDKMSESGVKVNDKWFHTDERSHLRLMTLQQLPTIPPDLLWKTMDGSFVTMTEELLSNVIDARLLTEIANFKNGEKHKMRMLQSENPLEYDFSDGWCEIYQEVEDE
ncbi:MULTISPECIES: DUF4376 domain-containing protein [Pasteurellaceae]|nr:DUF4376 domain-containing protein [Pasteurella atlantica]MBR0573357.1 DUF4376 domain-containing protein [Pasteurella atlantica]MDP8039835.1 DUF4376 domain-containing protein [Pasteurella atlantica]MDP8041852.1 DUF4376 domain-containing protein [Pasteurella atlantica]MDP8043919.1 DUF4376 domain-containing protein [Pasteurella atlantica]MDP8061929.1 DUF4376 domain-containing protein [Pasteurella atlantica]